jgi:hypothetical protein
VAGRYSDETQQGGLGDSELSTLIDNKDFNSCCVGRLWGVPMSDYWEKTVNIVRRHFETKGYRVHSGLQFGCELVLYVDAPERVHSDFCVHIVREGRLHC